MTPPPIKKIILHNIQSLPHAEIEPAPPGQMTTIIGSSDSGKTALASRALRKLFFNPPDLPNRELIRRGAKQASISVIYDTPDNLTVSWRWKGRNPEAGKACYEIARDDAEPIILEGGGKSVPQAIQDITGVHPVVIGDQELNFNFNRQLDGPFLGDKFSPGKRYRVLGTLAGTLEVDQAIRDVSLEITRVRRRENEIVKEIDDFEAKIKEYDYLEDLGRNIQAIEAAVAEIRCKQELRNKLSALHDEIISRDEILEELDLIIIAVGRMIDEIESQLSSITNLANKYRSLLNLKSNLQHETESLTRANSILSSTMGTEMASERLNNLTQANHKRGILMSSQTALTKAGDGIKRFNVIMEQTAGADEAKNILAQVDASAPKVAKLRDLAGRLQRGREFIAGVDKVLATTEGVDNGMDILSQVKAAVVKRGNLINLNRSISDTGNLVSRKTEEVAQLDSKISTATKEYRTLLRDAGICEHCSVVAEVMAAVG